VAIWDQGGSMRPPPATTARGNPGAFAKFDYGAEILKLHMDAAIAAAPAEGLPRMTRRDRLYDHATGTPANPAKRKGDAPAEGSMP
jgi:hypothetical protein